jgi:hypothetical protein
LSDGSVFLGGKDSTEINSYVLLIFCFTYNNNKGELRVFEEDKWRLNHVAGISESLIGKK